MLHLIKIFLFLFFILIINFIELISDSFLFKIKTISRVMHSKETYLKKDYAHGAIVRMKLENFV